MAIKNKLIALAVVGGAVIVLKMLKKSSPEKTRGYCEKLGEKIDQGLESLTSKAEDILHHQARS